MSQMQSAKEEMGKMFVGGLSWETSQDALCGYFSRYGEVVDCVVMRNNETGRSRGFGFVTFKDPSCVETVLADGPHSLDGRSIDPKACNPRTMQRVKKVEHYKVFLGGLPSNVTETDLRTHFSKFGKVMEVVIMYDQEKKRSRGFGFLSFDSEDSVDRVCAEQYLAIHGKQVEIKKAEPRSGRPMGGGGGGGRFNNHWNGAGMGSGGMPPPHMGGGPPMGGPGMGGPPQMPNGMPGYQASGWGAPQTAYPQGPFGNPPAPGYPGWGQQPSSYTPYPTPYGAPPAYGYGYGYGWTGPPSAQGAAPAPVPPAGAPLPVGPVPSAGSMSATSAGLNGQVSGAAQAASAGAAGSAVPVKQEYGPAYGNMGSYQQDASGYGPSRNFGQDGFNSSGANYGGGQGDASQSGAYNNSGSNGNRSSNSHAQNYHPYRRQ